MVDGVITLDSVMDFNVFYYAYGGLFALGLVVGVLLGCFFWSVSFEKVG